MTGSFAATATCQPCFKLKLEGVYWIRVDSLCP